MSFKVGDKVIPISKSINGSFLGSYHIGIMKEKGLKFLYITRAVYEGTFSCSSSQKSGTGDWFLEEDLVLFKESREIKLFEDEL